MSLEIQLIELAGKWKIRAGVKIADASAEKSEMGKRLIEHGAACYANAATEMEAVLGEFGFQPSNTRKAKKPSTTHLGQSHAP